MLDSGLAPREQRKAQVEQYVASFRPEPPEGPVCIEVGFRNGGKAKLTVETPDEAEDLLRRLKTEGMVHNDKIIPPHQIDYVTRRGLNFSAGCTFYVGDIFVADFDVESSNA